MTIAYNWVGIFNFLDVVMRQSMVKESVVEGIKDYM